MSLQPSQAQQKTWHKWLQLCWICPFYNALFPLWLSSESLFTCTDWNIVTHSPELYHFAGSVWQIWNMILSKNCVSSIRVQLFSPDSNSDVVSALVNKIPCARDGGVTYGSRQQVGGFRTAQSKTLHCTFLIRGKGSQASGHMIFLSFNLILFISSVFLVKWKKRG